MPDWDFQDPGRDGRTLCTSERGILGAMESQTLCTSARRIPTPQKARENGAQSGGRRGKSKRAVAAAEWIPRGDSCDSSILWEHIDPSAGPFRNSDRRGSPNGGPHGRGLGGWRVRDWDFQDPGRDGRTLCTSERGILGATESQTWVGGLASAGLGFPGSWARWSNVVYLGARNPGWDSGRWALVDSN